MRLLPALFLSLLAIPRFAFAAWTIVPYDPASGAGWSPSLRMGPGPFVDASVPNIAYWSPGSGFHYYDGVSTQSANPPLAASGPPDQLLLIKYGEAALALVEGGKPWIAEATLDSDHPAQNALTIAHQENGAWVGEPMGQTLGLLSIDYDFDTGKLHLFHQTSAGMVYAWRQGGTWHSEPFESTTAFGVLELDPAGNPALAYVTSGRLYYATRVGNGWQSVLVDGASNPGVPALAFNGTGRPRILYGHSTGVGPGDYFLRYAYETNGAWTTEPIAVAGGSVYDYDLAMLGDVPYIAFQDSVAATFGTRGPGGWTVEDIDPQTPYGQYPTIVIDDAYRPIIAYQAAGFGARYAIGSQIVGVSPTAPPRLQLTASSAVPAPRGASIALTADAPRASAARLTAFDVSGRTIGAAHRVALEAGPNRLAWQTPSRPGLAFLRLVTDKGEVATVRVVIL